ncbi:hypothetical protein CDD80_6370 [Ophiocordyceps camponoti-rufipedis]|uniref:PAN2-PAN3 deadenylation complex subunit PAN3 n=1 Tax=Ophiocordyceps camponoti-rufipedis TaxID=2004952 RepID=A0A2C5XEX8_9HYPO|nr:hypothetical protein CDD80_6370 [Ophiocordyceps camponoti-rufipedis]
MGAKPQRSIEPWQSTAASAPSKKALNVESPSFTPASILPPALKKATIPTQAASAPAFTPRAMSGKDARLAAAGSSFLTRALAGTPVTAPAEVDAAVFNPAAIREFTPGLDVSSQPPNGSNQDPFDAFAMAAVGQNLPQAPFNPYAEDHNAMAGSSSYFPPQGAFTTPLQPLQHHLYAPWGPRREDLMPYHRMAHEFFMPEKLRQEMQKKAEATLQVIPNSQLPQLDNYHSLVALDTTHRKNPSIFGYPSWVYKATSSKTGHVYILRRLEGFRLTNEHAIRSVKEWRKVDNANVVTVHDAFTARAFGDSSLIFVQDYFPLAKTLAEAHFAVGPGPGNRYQPKGPITEPVLWSYIAQIANALRAIHAANLAARCVDASKIVLTDKNRVRLNACAVLDVVQFEMRRPLRDLQQDDLVQFGRTMLCLATSTPSALMTNLNASVEQMSRSYSAELRDTIVWLLTPQQPPAVKSMDEFIRGVAGHIVTAFEESQHSNDQLNAELFRELENGRIARLLMKLGTVNERYEFDGDRAWSENGERYMLKLFRDYVFHQVDGSGNPVVDIGHMVRCLNRLDAGTEERVCLTSRDEQTSFLVSYKELKKQLGNAFGELQKGSGGGAGKQQGRGFYRSEGQSGPGDGALKREKKGDDARVGEPGPLKGGKGSHTGIKFRADAAEFVPGMKLGMTDEDGQEDKVEDRLLPTGPPKGTAKEPRMGSLPGPAKKQPHMDSLPGPAREPDVEPPKGLPKGPLPKGLPTKPPPGRPMQLPPGRASEPHRQPPPGPAMEYLGPPMDPFMEPFDGPMDPFMGPSMGLSVMADGRLRAHGMRGAGSGYHGASTHVPRHDYDPRMGGQPPPQGALERHWWSDK